MDVVGDTRFDRVLQIKEAAKHLPICEAFRNGVAGSDSAASSEKASHPDYKVFVAGSSWPPDEEIFIRFFNEHKDWRLLIAPHVIAEFILHLKQSFSLLQLSSLAGLLLHFHYLVSCILKSYLTHHIH